MSSLSLRVDDHGVWIEDDPFLTTYLVCTKSGNRGVRDIISTKGGQAGLDLVQMGSVGEC
jgi:hypothetical protein